MARSNYRTFLLFIAFTIAAAVLWFLFRYNNTYEEYTDVSIEWSNVPVDVELADSSREVKVPIKIRSSGFRLLWLHYEDLKVPLDFKTMVNTNSNALVFNPESARTAIDRAMGDGIDILEIEANPITLEYQRFDSKIVPIEKNFKVDFTGSYKELGTSSFDVDQVKITGNNAIIKELEALAIDMDDVTVSDSIVSLEVDLNALYPNLKIEPNKVTYTVRAAEMTEGSFKIPVTIKNRPIDGTVKIIPDMVTVVFISKLVDYDSINKNDFKVSVDISEIDNGEATVVPILEYDNEKINTARVQPQFVQILVIQ
ncbi:YbbR-like protein [Nonlabens sp. Hel1_33_55]|uniref:CdaR family protein n=1 Tax=Nonlabens sp. Hel1_33_55 TaxID=1336802 RepID=UPI000875C31C|nr:YbbR-like domain-containing protein [Nonlabens sp. Hel1_33_55]SCY13354.1 YbbR-like protein [Nonlabens sp. Hel1_33_55]